MNNYTVYHLHSELSLLDSTTNYKDYILRAKDSGQKAICFTEHGNTYNWVEKKMFCEMTHYKVYHDDVFEYTDAKHLDKVKQRFYEFFHCDPFIKELPPIKYIHGVEVYLTETLDEKIKDNYHTILIAKNYQGLREINVLVDLSTTESHMYYKPRISFEEFMQISDNVIKTSACLASPLWKLYKSGDPHQWVERLLPHYDFLEVQPHNHQDQKEFNIWLYNLSKAFDIPLIAGTDTHSISQYKAECRTMLQYAKNIDFGDEDTFDLTWKSYDDLVHMFEEQGVLPEQAYLEAIKNTNRMADSVEDFQLDLSFKYPKLYDNEEEVFVDRIKKMYWEKVNAGIIEDNPVYETKIREELRVLKKIGMIGFMLFMSELVCWCHENDIPTGPCRGSVGGSTVAYITGIIDVNPVIWNTVFSRFANEDRMEIGDEIKNIAK